ncbi:MAG: M48 family metallopeptidase [Planctomycetes bacterium]|nr:M48 family metallopeptidase [Planctomycetota bacterium]
MAARKAPSMAGRALLALLLMIGFYVLAIAICIALAALVYVDITSPGRKHVKLYIFAAVTIGVVVWSIVPRKAAFPDPGIRLTKQRQPRLFSMIEDVAKAAGQPVPKSVFLVNEINAFVAERNARLGFGGERVLGLGLPLMRVLTVPQIKSVIAHEFGHFHGGDTKLGPFLYRTRASIGRTITNLQNADSFLHKPFEWYGKLFLKTTFGISRAQEYAADALSVRIVGVEPVQTSLRRIGEIGPLFDSYLDHEYVPMLRRGVRPPLADGFASYLESADVREMQVSFGESAMQAKGDPYDSHPPISQRIRAAGDVEGAGSESADGPHGVTLLDDVDTLERDLMVFVTQNRSVAEIPADSWARCAGVLQDGWREVAAEHAGRLPAFTCEDIASIARGEREADGDAAGIRDLETFAATISAQIPREERVGAGAYYLGAFLAHAMASHGFEVRTAPGDPIVLHRGESSLQPFDAVGRLARNETDVESWCRDCEQLGISKVLISGTQVAEAAGAKPNSD